MKIILHKKKLLNRQKIIISERINLNFIKGKKNMKIFFCFSCFSYVKFISIIFYKE